MADSQQGITRRDLLRRGAVLGGAVMWTTPVVQTLGMGRAFAANGTPVGGKDVSYAVISWECNGVSERKKVKWEPGVGFSTQGALPDCDNVGGTYAGAVPEGLAVSIASNPACILVTVPAADAFGCPDDKVSNVTAWVKAGSSQSSLEPCNPTPLSLDASGQLACSSEN